MPAWGQLQHLWFVEGGATRAKLLTSSIRSSASPGADWEGIPEGRGYTSAHVGRGPDSERPKRHYLLSRR
jgi:hypothetical protein